MRAWIASVCKKRLYPCPHGTCGPERKTKWINYKMMVVILENKKEYGDTVKPNLSKEEEDRNGI